LFGVFPFGIVFLIEKWAWRSDNTVSVLQAAHNLIIADLIGSVAGILPA
jgi:hypothetical protein